VKKRFAYLQCAFLGLALVAGSLDAFGRPDPADPGAPVPEVNYRSAFSDYQSYHEPEPVSWKQIHEEVAGVRGHFGLPMAI